MTKLQVINLSLKSSSNDLSVINQSKIFGGVKAANSMTSYGDSTSSINITQFESGDNGIVVNQVNTGDENIHIPYKKTSKILNYINQTGDGTVITEGL